MSDVDDSLREEDLEFLRQAALTSLLKKKAEAASSNAVFYRPSKNSNLISIQPVVADIQTSENGDHNCSTDSENEIIIAEGLSVSSSDCDEIVEEVVVSEDDDENNNEEKNQESSEGEDAVSVASKDSFDEILNSIEEEINGVTTGKTSSSTSSRAIKKSEVEIRNVGVVVASRKSIRSSERNLKTRSRSPIYRRSPDSRNLRVNHSTSRASRNTSRSRSPLRRRTRSRSLNRVNHSSYRNESRRGRSPVDFGRHRQSNTHRQEDKLVTSDRRRISRSPIEERGRSNDRRKRDDRERSPNNSQQKAPHNSKTRSRSTSRNRRTDRNTKSPPLRSETGRRNRLKQKSPSPAPESMQNLTAEERERFEKRKRKFQNSNVSVPAPAGKIVLKPKNEDNSKIDEPEPVVFTRTIEDDLPTEESYSGRKATFSKERLERKLKLSSRLGIKVTEEEVSAQQSNLEEEETINSSPNRETTGRLAESLESFETSSALAEQQKAATLNKEDLRSKLEQKRASGGGRLFSYALRDTFDAPSKSKKARRKVISMK